MPYIQQLPPHMADLIAAGEVVERPASVVKELVENSIDAGASAVVVEIQNGGMSLIRVTDNGCGIARSELSTAFLRHATSKLRAPEDLAAIGTLGFRGEALAAISAVSRVDVFSRQRGAALGASLTLEGGAPGPVEEAGCPEGTTFVVRDLFYNTPARLKFMKSDSAEASAVGGVLQQIALSRPDVSIRYLRDGKEELHTPGDGKLLSAVYAARGRDFAHSLVAVEGSGENIRVSGFVTEPLAGRGTRAMQTFFCCGRIIKSQLLTAALEEAYANRQLRGKYPGCVLRVDLPLHQVDVNVHPAKTVVKFAQERSIFSAVHHVVKDALDAAGGPEETRASGGQSALRAAARGDFFQTMDAKSFREGGASAGGKSGRPTPPAPGTGSAGDTANNRTGGRRPPLSSPELGGRVAFHDAVRRGQGGYVPLPEGFRTGTALPGETLPEGPPPSGGEAGGIPENRGAASEAGGGGGESSRVLAGEGEGCDLAAPSRVIAACGVNDSSGGLAAAYDRSSGVILPSGSNDSRGSPSDCPWRLVGEVLRTYIVAEDGEDVWLIDKHAAHERVNFDRLKAGAEPIMRQQLLAGMAVDLQLEQYAALLENLPLLEAFGFEAEDFGAGCLMVRAIPADIEAGLVRETLEMLADKLLTGGGADPDSARDAMLHTMACKAAIKGGWRSDPAELRALIDKVQSGEVQYCPHGRPVKVKLSKYEIEKLFKRA